MHAANLRRKKGFAAPDVERSGDAAPPLLMERERRGRIPYPEPHRTKNKFSNSSIVVCSAKKYIFAPHNLHVMATYNKRGYREPKEKEPKEKLDLVDELQEDAGDSTTAEVFSKLDETANKTEEWVARNQRYIIGFLVAVAVVTIGYLLYQKFVAEPKQQEAADEMFVAQQNFQRALDGSSDKDSLFNLALNGADGKYGFLKIADEYSSTDAGNLAHYYAGVSLLHTGKYDEAISHLEKFKAKDEILSALALGAAGDAYAQKNQLKEAADRYVKAAANANDFTAPRFLLKAGQVELAQGNKAEALKHFTEIKEKYAGTPESTQIDALIGLSTAQ
jgi:predicted negative regulator of RcsB-dependent stress response